MKTYQQTENVNPSPSQPIINNRQYLHTVSAGAWLPLAQATLTGVIIGLCILVIGFALDARHPETPALVIGVIAWAVSWLLLQRHWFGLTAIEKLIGMDLNRDGAIGKPEPRETPEIRVRLSQVKPDGHYQENIITLPASQRQLEALADGLTNCGMPFSERRWTGAGNPFSVDEFRALRSAMIRGRMLTLANEKDPRQGYILTPEGEQTMKRILEASPSPTPPMD